MPRWNGNNRRCCFCAHHLAWLTFHTPSALLDCIIGCAEKNCLGQIVFFLLTSLTQACFVNTSLPRWKKGKQSRVGTCAAQIKINIRSWNRVAIAKAHVKLFMIRNQANQPCLGWYIDLKHLHFVRHRDDLLPSQNYTSPGCQFQIFYFWFIFASFHTELAMYVLLPSADIVHRDLKLENILVKNCPSDGGNNRINIKVRNSQPSITSSSVCNISCVCFWSV